MEKLQRRKNIGLGNEGSACPFGDRLRSFMTHAKDFQDVMYSTECAYGHRIFFEDNESKQYLYLIIGRACGVEPDEQPSPNNYHTGFGKVKRKMILKPYDTIISENKKFECFRCSKGEVHIGVIYVLSFLHAEQNYSKCPLFKVFKSTSDEQAVFIDRDGTVYSSWNHFIHTNKLPPSLMCVPKDGSYVRINQTNKLDLEYLPSPSCLSPAKPSTSLSKRNAIILAADAVTLVGCTAIMVCAGPIGILAGIGVGFQGVSTVINGVKIICGDNSMTVPSENLIGSITCFLSTCFDTSIFATSASSAIWSTTLTGGLGVAAVGLTSYLLYATLSEAVKAHQNNSLSGMHALKVMSAFLLFSNVALKLPQCISLVKSRVWFRETALVRQVFIVPNDMGKKVVAKLNNYKNVLVQQHFSDEKLCDILSKFYELISHLFNSEMTWEEYFCRVKIFFGIILGEAIDVTEVIVKKWVQRVSNTDDWRIVPFLEPLGLGIESFKLLLKEEKIKLIEMEKRRLCIAEPAEAAEASEADGERKEASRDENPKITDICKKLMNQVGQPCVKMEQIVRCYFFVEKIALERAKQKIFELHQSGQSPNHSSNVVYDKVLTEMNTELSDSPVGGSEIWAKFIEMWNNEEKSRVVKLVEKDDGELYVAKYDSEGNLKSDVEEIVGSNVKENQSLKKFGQDVREFTCQDKHIFASIDCKTPGRNLAYIRVRQVT